MAFKYFKHWFFFSKINKTNIYRWIIRQVSQHNQQNVIQQEHAERLNEALIELCEACTDGYHVAAPY